MPIRKHKTKRDGIKYRVEVCIKGTRKSKVFSTKSEAALWEEEITEVLKTGKSTKKIIAPGDKDFEKACDQFILEKRGIFADKTLDNYDLAKIKFLQSWGKVLMSEITEQMVRAHLLRRMTEDGVGASIAASELSFLRTLYEHARAWGIEIPSPEKSVQRPKRKKPGREDKLEKVIKPDEIHALLFAAKLRTPGLYEYLLFLLYTGMRPSEASNLLWKRLPKREEKAYATKKYHTGYVDFKRGGFSGIGTKTEKRFVPAHPVIIDLLKTMREKAPTDKMLVFLDDDLYGRKDGYKFYRRSFYTALEQARIRSDQEQNLANKVLKSDKGPLVKSRELKLIGVPIRETINFYSFRHTFRSNMARSGIPTEISETILGHSDDDFKYTYIHLEDEVLIDQIAKLSFPGLEKI